MADLIGRIDTWKADFKGYIDCLDIPMDDYNGIMEYIDEVPSAEPRQKAHWINVRDGNIADCGMCNARGRAWMNFCPICGADMRG